MIKISSFLKQQATMTKNNLLQFPSGTWGFVGSVYQHLMFVKKDNSEITQDDLKNAGHFGPAVAGVKQRSWPTPLEALKAAKKYNQTVTITKELTKNKNIMDAVSKTGVKVTWG